MRRTDWRYLTLAAASIALAGIATLWSWNTLAALFGVPTAEFRHLVAALTIALVARALISRRHRRQ